MEGTVKDIRQSTSIIPPALQCTVSDLKHHLNYNLHCIMPNYISLNPSYHPYWLNTAIIITVFTTEPSILSYVWKYPVISITITVPCIQNVLLNRSKSVEVWRPWVWVYIQPSRYTFEHTHTHGLHWLP